MSRCPRSVVGPALVAMLAISASAQPVALKTILRHPAPPAADAPVGFGTQVALGPNIGPFVYGSDMIVASRSEWSLGYADLRVYRFINGTPVVASPYYDNPAPFNPSPQPPLVSPRYSNHDQYTIGIGARDPGGSGNIGFFENGGPVMVGAYNAPKYQGNDTWEIQHNGRVYGITGVAGLTQWGWLPFFNVVDPPGSYPFLERNTQFGRVLVCGGDWTAVSEPGSGRVRRLVHVISREQVARVYGVQDIYSLKITAPPDTGATGSDRFGESLALAANVGWTLTDGWLAVGAPGESTGATGVNTAPIPLPTAATRLANAGAVYLYRLAQGTATLAATLKADNPDAGDEFGSAIAMDAAGETLLVGAPSEDSSASGINSPSRGNDGSPVATGLDRGAVYVFRRSGDNWALTDYLKPFETDFPSNQRNGHRFGRRLAVDGPHLAVQGGGFVGSASLVSVYLFRREPSGAWTARQRITPPATNWIGGRDFGNSLAMSSGYLAIGAATEGTISAATGRGAVALYSGVYDAPPAPPKPTVPVLSLPGDGNATLLWFGQPGANYRLVKSTNLLDWTSQLTMTADAADGWIQFTDPAPASTSGFYKLEKE